MNLKKQIDQIFSGGDGYWSARLYAEMDYLQELFAAEEGVCTDAFERAAVEMAERKRQNGALTRRDVLDAEDMLSSYSNLAKKYSLYMVSHAHIDMNWRWGYDETVGIIIDTFLTMLRLLDEYPEFIFQPVAGGCL